MLRLALRQPVRCNLLREHEVDGLLFGDSNLTDSLIGLAHLTTLVHQHLVGHREPVLGSQVMHEVSHLHSEIKKARFTYSGLGVVRNSELLVRDVLDKNRGCHWFLSRKG